MPGASSVHVLVVNGTSIADLAGGTATYLRSRGFLTLPATNATTQVTGTQVYVVSGPSSTATAVTNALGLAPAPSSPRAQWLPCKHGGSQRRRRRRARSGPVGAGGDHDRRQAPRQLTGLDRGTGRRGRRPRRRLGPLAALLENPAASAVLSDFDGTLSPIVADPALARPLPEAPGVLLALARHFGVVAVVSGRPVSFLAQRLAAAGPEVRLFGAYGLEWIEDGTVHRAPAVEPWRGPVAEVVDAARSEFAGEAVGIEDKEISVTVHWRQAPEAGDRAWEFARQWSRRTGLLLQAGRMAVEFRPPVGIDKGSVVEALARAPRGGVLRRRRRR